MIFSALGPLLLSAGVIMLVYRLLGASSTVGRAIGSAICIATGVRYVWWHATVAMPQGQTLAQQAWAWTFLGFEAMALLGSVTVYVFMIRTRDRSAEADAVRHSPLQAAPVDVFIATFNEPYAILERTIVGALAIDHADLRVWVLDDGARDWVRALAQELGAQYVRRVGGEHAKAGNINHGLRVALATGRRPAFVLMLDADFVADRRILRRTLGFFEAADIGIVQTPQHFFNPDPIQANLLCASVWPDEQRFFFNVLLAAKDAWGAAFCCGTSAVFRVAALVAAGGMATETVTEDMLTTFKLQEHGYRTILLNERLSLGLAPEGLREYISQRSRWCLGAIQQLYTRWSFAGPARISLINRISALDGVLYWMFSFPFKLMMISCPAIYWWTGSLTISADIPALLYWLGPSAVAGAVYMALYGRGLVLPIMTDMSQFLSAIPVMRTVAGGLLRPWGRAFKVTAKGVSTDHVTVQWGSMLPFAVLAAATFGGLLRNVSGYAPLAGTAGYTVNVVWSVFNIAVLLLAICVCIELPKRRKDERFAMDEAAVLRLRRGEEIPCTVRDMSLSGARVAGLPAWLAGHDGACLSMDGGRLEIPCGLARLVDEDIALQFADTPPVRRALIAKLFTGAYVNEVDRIRIGRVLLTVGRQLVA